jgi:hypothetical protein
MGALAAPLAWQTWQLLAYLSISGAAIAPAADIIKTAAKSFFMGNLWFSKGLVRFASI